MKYLRSLVCAALALALACGGDDGPGSEACSSSSDCAEPGNRCVNGFCVPRTEDAGTPGDAAVARDASLDVGSAPDGAVRDAGGTDAGVCGAVVEVSTLEQLMAQVPSAYGSPESAAWLSQESSSADLRATATLTVLPDDFPDPTDCEGCTVRLEQDSALAGVSSVSGGGLRIEPGAVFRMRFSGAAVVGATVRFQRPCAALCLATELRCEEDHACYETGPDYCRACDHGTSSRCACVGSDGEPLPDGSSCSTGLQSGTCQDGKCVDRLTT